MTCFWFNNETKKDSVYLFDDLEVKRFTNPLTLSEIASLRDFSSTLKPSLRPNREMIDDMVMLLLKIKAGKM